MKSCTQFSAIALTIPLMAPVFSLAQNADEEQRRWLEQSSMRENAVRATDILAGDVSSRFNFVGEVRDLILSENGDQVQYVIYDIPYPYNRFGNANNGYVTFDKVELERGYGTGLDVRFDDEAAARPPEELKLKRGQADNRMVSRLLERSVSFSGNEQREIDDMVINPKSGAVTHYIIQMDQDTVFGTKSRTIPADRVSIDKQGRINTKVKLNEVDKLQEFDADRM